MVGVGFLLRLIFVFLNYKALPNSAHFERFGAEMGWTARSLALGRGFSSPFYPVTGPTALVPPFFPLVLAGVFKLFGVYSQASAFVALTLNSLLSALTSVVIFFGLRRRFGYPIARLGAWLWALFPYAIYYSAVYLWDCALTSLLLASCFFIAWNHLPHARSFVWAAWGLLAGMAALSNPSVFSLLPLFLAYAAWQRCRMRRPFAGRTLLSIATLCAALAPWCVRNLRVMHEPVFIRDGFWGEFYAGNSGDTSHSNPGWTHPASNATELRTYEQLGEAGYMARKRSLSLLHIKADPEAFALVSARRVLRFWTGYWSFSQGYLQDEALDLPNVPFCTLLALLTVIGLVGLCKGAGIEASPVLAAVLLFPLPYYVTHASIDYRQPIEPILISLIALGLYRLRHKSRSCMHRHSMFTVHDLARDALKR